MEGKKGKVIPVQVWKGPEGSKNFRVRDFQSAHEKGTVVSPTHRPPLPTGTYSAQSTSGPQCGRKNEANKKTPMTPTEIEPATFRFVAQCSPSM
jgi:hypothetical protein